MDQHTLQHISQEVYRQYPEFKGVRPKVQTQGSTAKGSGASTFLLTFQQEVVLPDRRKLNRMLRVVADENGKIIRVTTSR